MASENPQNRPDRRSVIDHEQAEQETQDFYSQKDRIEDLIEYCSRALGRGDRRHYAYVAKRLRDTIIPELEDLAGARFIEYDGDLDAKDTWEYPALATFRRNADEIVDSFLVDESPALDRLQQQGVGFTDADAAARKVVEGALGCCVALAEHKDVVMESYSKEADAVGFTGLKVGHHLQKGNMDFGDPVEAIVDAQGKTKSLYTGPTGSAKSTGSERQFEDFYRMNFQPGPDCKCIDPADFTSAENIFYDVEQRQEELRDLREDDYDLPPSFEDIDDFEPKQEVYIPLTPNLDEARIPYDTEDEEFLPKFFTIPACDISKELFVTIVTARVSEGERRTIQSVYRSVDREQEDWTLNDMVREILTREELSEKHKKSAIRSLRAVQDMGFIRRSDSEHTLDWDEIFTSNEVITVFNQSLCPNGEAKLFTLAWLLEEMWEHRRFQLVGPQAALLVRELWEIVPHNRRDSDSDIEAALQKRIATLLTKFQRKIRDVRMHLVADTQKVMDIHNGVREMFNRYVVYQAADSTVENIYGWASNDEWWRFASTLNPEPGIASITGQVGPAIEDRDKEFIGPVKMVPPSFHHHDKDQGPGWLKRVDFVESEELRSPEDWPVDIPEDLEVGSPSDYDAEDDSEDGEQRNKKEFHRYEARNRRRNGTSYQKIADALPPNPDTGESYSKSTIYEWTKDIDPSNAGGNDD